VDVVPLDVVEAPVHQKTLPVNNSVSQEHQPEQEQQPEAVPKERDWKSLQRIARETRREVKSLQYKRLLEGKI